MKKLSRALILMLALLLAFLPMSVLADTSNNEVTYVSLGDSLAAGQLYDKSIGKGYVENIVEQLEANGYDVSMENFGVPGAKTSDVLAGIVGAEEDLINADIVTISAGANDLLTELDMGKVGSFDPNEITKVQGELTAAVLSTFAATEEAAQNLTKDGAELEKLLEDVMSEVSPLLPLLPEQIQVAIGIIENNFQNVEENLSAANAGLELVKESFTRGEIEGLSHLASVLADLEAATENLDNILSAITAVKDFPTLPNEVSMIVDQVKAKTEEMKTAVQAVHQVISVGSESINSLVTEFEDLIKEAQEIEQMFEKVQNKIGVVGENMAKIIETAQNLNPQAKIYVLGYYNALPYLPENMQDVTVPLIQGLNGAIEGAAKAKGAIFVPTFKSFENDYQLYLPNPSDIHPSEVGYKVLAAAFMSKINKSFPKILVLGEATEVFSGQTITISGTKVTLELPHNLPYGTVLTVTATDEEIVAKATNLQAVGDVLNFDFQFRPVLASFENSESEDIFTLTFGYEHDSNDVDIYYFDEEQGEWTSLGGEVNEEIKEVTVEVSHFSNYGVFAEVVEPPIEDDETDDEIDDEIDETDDESDDEKDENGVGKKDDDESKQEDEKKVGKKQEKKQGSGGLPKTATNQYNLLVLGTLLIGLGITLFEVARRRKEFA